MYSTVYVVYKLYIYCVLYILIYHIWRPVVWWDLYEASAGSLAPQQDSSCRPEHSCPPPAAPPAGGSTTTHLQHNNTRFTQNIHKHTPTEYTQHTQRHTHTTQQTLWWAAWSKKHAHILHDDIIDLLLILNLQTVISQRLHRQSPAPEVQRLSRLRQNPPETHRVLRHPEERQTGGRQMGERPWQCLDNQSGVHSVSPCDVIGGDTLCKREAGANPSGAEQRLTKTVGRINGWTGTLLHHWSWTHRRRNETNIRIKLKSGSRTRLHWAKEKR